MTRQREGVGRMSKPAWLDNEPPTPLEQRLSGRGKRYAHSILCSGNPFKPIGESGCICLRWLRHSAEQARIRYKNT